MEDKRKNGAKSINQEVVKQERCRKFKLWAASNNDGQVKVKTFFSLPSSLEVVKQVSVLETRKKLWRVTLMTALISHNIIISGPNQTNHLLRGRWTTSGYSERTKQNIFSVLFPTQSLTCSKLKLHEANWIKIATYCLLSGSFDASLRLQLREQVLWKKCARREARTRSKPRQQVAGSSWPSFRRPRWLILLLCIVWMMFCWLVCGQQASLPIAR